MFRSFYLFDRYRICELYKPNHGQWALQSKAILDRVQLVLSDRSKCYQKKIQPSAKYLGNLLGVQKSAVCCCCLTFASIVDNE